MKTTLNPFENAKRTAQGAGGVAPAIIEEMQEQISVLGSQNSQQAQDIADIKEALLNIHDYNFPTDSTEVDTGKTWSDGDKIFVKKISGSFGQYSTITTGVKHIIAVIGYKNTGREYGLNPNDFQIQNASGEVQYGASETATINGMLFYTKTGA